VTTVRSRRTKWVIALISSQYVVGEYLTDAWFNENRGRWSFEFDVADESGDVLTWTTKAAALDAFEKYDLDPEQVEVRRWVAPGVH